MAERLSRREVPEALRVAPGRRVRLRDSEAARVFGWDKDRAQLALDENVRRLGELQHKLYADGRFGLLVVLQAIDGGGKDSTIRHVFTGINPQGCQVTAFKAPSAEELHHDYLWRVHHAVPPRGKVGVFNRSHYEDVLVVRVDGLAPQAVWSKRYQHLNDFERFLTDCNYRVVKIFLQIGKSEQKRRFEERLRDPKKHWKFDPHDLGKRAQWDAYRRAFEDALTRCSTEWAPWYVIPADRKWFRDFAVSQLLVQELERLPLRFPRPTFDPAKIRVR